jgi:hypothetical protein
MHKILVRVHDQLFLTLTSSRDALFRPSLLRRGFGRIRYKITAAIIINIIHVKLSALSEFGLAIGVVISEKHSLSVHVVWLLLNCWLKNFIYYFFFLHFFIMSNIWNGIWATNRCLLMYLIWLKKILLCFPTLISNCYYKLHWFLSYVLISCFCITYFFIIITYS